MKAKRNDRFDVKEVSFQEGVDVADEDFGDALDSFDLGSTQATAKPAAGNQTPQLMADVMATPAPSAAKQPAPPPLEVRVEQRSLISRLFGWMFRSRP